MSRQRAERQLDLGTKPDAGLRGLDGELWLARRLGKHGVLVVFEGDTDPETRKERMRQAILDRGLAPVICGRGRDGKPNTYALAFERLYGEYLNGNPTRGSKHADAIQA